jgi:hypothetical protein
MQMFDEMFTGQEISKAVKEESIRIAAENRIKNTLPILYLGLLYEETPYMKEVYLDLFGKEFKVGEDLLIIQSEIKRLIKRYNLMYKKEKPAQEGTTLEELIIGVEMLLDRTIDRELKLYQFKTYHEMALRKAENG